MTGGPRRGLQALTEVVKARTSHLLRRKPPAFMGREEHPRGQCVVGRSAAAALTCVMASALGASVSWPPGSPPPPRPVAVPAATQWLSLAWAHLPPDDAPGHRPAAWGLIWGEEWLCPDWDQPLPPTQGQSVKCAPGWSGPGSRSDVRPGRWSLTRGAKQQARQYKMPWAQGRVAPTALSLECPQESRPPQTAWDPRRRRRRWFLP